MKGQFICVTSFGNVTSHPVRGNVLGVPSVTDIAECYDPIQRAEKVLFYGEDSSIWLIKDRYGLDELPRCLVEGVSR